MKRFLSLAGQRIRRIAQTTKRRYARLLGSSVPQEEPVGGGPPIAEAVAVVPEPEVVRTAGRRKKSKSPQAKPASQWSLADFAVPEVVGKRRFHDYPVPVQIMRAIADLGFEYCTPVQEKALADVLAGRDLVGKANTGTGKTAVFLVAILARLLAAEKRSGKARVQALILAPTRELVVQITKDGEELSKYCDLSIKAVYGGVDYQKQLDEMQRNRADIVVATPGRLLDFLGKGAVRLDSCSILVLDEADRMLDMGFIPDVRRIIGRMPPTKERQTLLFSATVPDDVRRLAMQWCNNPAMVEAEPDQVAAETIEEVVYLATRDEKYTILYNLIRTMPEERVIVFANMKNETKRLADRLQRDGVDCVLLSGDVEQKKRMSRLESFRSGRVKVLVATDVAGRGIHIEGITLVVNFTLPFEPEDYVHRIGRTGRAGASGKAVSFACEEGGFYLPAIEEYIGRKVACKVVEEDMLTAVPKAPLKKTQEPQPASGPKKRRPRRRHKRSGDGAPNTEGKKEGGDSGSES